MKVLLSSFLHVLVFKCKVYRSKQGTIAIHKKMLFHLYLHEVCFLLAVPVPPRRSRNSRFPTYQIEHPPVLTRPPAPKTPAMRRTTTTTTPEPRATQEPMDMDEMLMHHLGTTQPWYDMYGGGGSSFNSYSYNSPVYDYFGYSGGASAGGASAEAEFGGQTTTPAYDPASVPKTRTRSGRRRNRPVATPAPPTTTTPPPPTTPEPADEPDMMGLLSMMTRTMRRNSVAGVGNAKSYCYCSPLSQCPRGSVRRGDNSACQNFISFFLNIRYQRCCYRPSVLKQYGF